MNKLPPPLSVIDMYYHFRVLFGDPERYGAATSRVFAIYEIFPGKIMSVLLEHNYLFFLISNP